MYKHVYALLKISLKKNQKNISIVQPAYVIPVFAH